MSSFFAGTVCHLADRAVLRRRWPRWRCKFGPAEYFSLMVLGLVASIVLAHGSLLHALGMIVLGLLLGLVGTDVNSGDACATRSGCRSSADGINFVVVAMGVFGLGEIVSQPGDREGPRPDGRRRSPG
ncbi:MAG: tripartite tricarboxylate transporter permease [Microthrixaceae bacterium]